MSLDDLKERAAGSGFVFEAIKDDTGVKGISLSFHQGTGLDHFYVLNDDYEKFRSFITDVFSHSHMKVCFDIRDVISLGIELKGYCDVMAVSTMMAEENHVRAVNSVIKECDIEEFERSRKRLSSHVKACKTAKIDLSKHSLIDVVPSKLMMSLYRLKNEMTWELYGKLPEHELDRFKNVIYGRLASLFKIEKSRVSVNPVDYVEGEVGDRRFIEDLKRRSYDGFVDVRYGTVFKKTGRVHPKKSFWNCMNIPNTYVRRSIVSGWDGGVIARMDLNAADYRCIMASTDDEELNMLYSEDMDFHDRTAELLFGLGRSNQTRRRVVKDITYMMLYGGSDEVLMKKTGLSREMLEGTLKRLDEYVAPLVEFKEMLFEKSMVAGYVENPAGLRMKLAGDEHMGKVLAWYAQSCANEVFFDGVAAVLRELESSLALFTVHDELVIDVHPDEISKLNELKEAMELGSSALFGVRMRSSLDVGPNYWEMKRWS